jgi:sarcosine oxidase subunit gamma
MAELPTARTALDPHAATLAGLPYSAREVRLASQLELRLEPGSAASPRIAAALGAAIPTAPCTSTRSGDLSVLWLGPDQWLLVGPPGRQDALGDLIRTAAGDEFVAVTDVSAQRVALWLSGPLVPDLLARGCAIDLHPSVSPIGTCVQTLLAQTGVTIVVEQAGATAVLILIRPSFVDYLVAWLVDASRELAA